MGKQALRSHMKSQKHTKRTTASQNSLLNYVSSQQSLAHIHKVNEPSSAPSTSDKPESSGRAQLDQYVFKNDVTEAAILWCIETVMIHKSLRAAEKDISIMKRMFHDCAVASKLQLKKDKIAYVLMYGIAPYFKTELTNRINRGDFYVAGLDESLNKVTKKQQMDLNIRYWDEESNSVLTCYFTSRFLTRSRATDLLQAFQELLNLLKKNAKNC